MYVHMVFLVLAGKELVVLLLGVPLQMLVLVGDQPLLPVFMGTWLQLVVMQLMLLALLSLLFLWGLRLPGLAHAHLLVLVQVGTYMRLVVGPLVVLMQMLVRARARLLLAGGAGTFASDGRRLGAAAGARGQRVDVCDSGGGCATIGASAKRAGDGGGTITIACARWRPNVATRGHRVAAADIGARAFVHARYVNYPLNHNIYQYNNLAIGVKLCQLITAEGRRRLLIPGCGD
jgi:hypothetical protein